MIVAILVAYEYLKQAPLTRRLWADFLGAGIDMDSASQLTDSRNTTLYSHIGSSSPRNTSQSGEGLKAPKRLAMIDRSTLHPRILMRVGLSGVHGAWHGCGGGTSYWPGSVTCLWGDVAMGKGRRLGPDGVVI